MDWISGAKKSEARRQSPVTTATSPVRPPEAVPAALST